MSKGMTTYSGNSKFTKRTSGNLSARNQRRLERKGKKPNHMKKIRWEGDALMIPQQDHKSYLEVIHDSLEALKNCPTPPEEGTILTTPEGIVFKFKNGEWELE